MKTMQIRSLTSLIVSAMLFFSSNVFAQLDEKQSPPGQDNDRFGPPHMMKTPMHKKAHFPDIPDLTDEQKEQIKELEINFMKEVLPFKNHIGEREASLRTLTTEEEADMNAIYNIIEEIGELNLQIMKKRAAQHQEIRKILSADQRIVFDLRPQHYEKHPKKNW